MALTITPEALYFGAPTSLTVNGTEVGATIDAPKMSFAVTNYTPKFQGSKGPIVGTVITTEVIPSVEFTVNELTAEKIAWAMPGSTGSGTWTAGRIDSAAYVDVILVGTGLDGRTITFTVNNAMSSEPQELEFGDSGVAGLKLKFTGYYAAATPTVVPFSLVISA